MDGSECSRLGNQLRCEKGERVIECSRHGETTLRNCASCADFLPLPPMKEFTWAVAVTTCPRPNGKDYLPETLASLAEAGWFCPDVFTDSHKSLGAFGNFYVAMTTLAMRFPQASAYLYCQDDVRFDKDTRTCCTSILSEPKTRRTLHVLSLYWPGGRLMDHEIGVSTQRDNGWNSPGACCYAFSAWGLRDLLSDPIVLRHRWRGHSAAIDGCVGEWASKYGGIWHHDPPLSEHTGEVSAIWTK